MQMTLDQMEDFLLENQELLRPGAKISEEEKEKCKACIEALCDAGNCMGLRLKAYGHYTGSNIYEQDWQESEKYLLRMLEESEDACAAGSLGYIAYYGRTNGGVPDYEKALKYFSIAALADNSEAKYKLCDLLLAGKGFPVKMPHLAESVLRGLYCRLGPEFLDGSYGCEFADVAIRLGRIYMAWAESNEEAVKTAYAYFLIGRRALELRMQKKRQFGDESVMRRLLPDLEKAKALYHELEAKQGIVRMNPAFHYILHLAADHEPIAVSMKKGKDDRPVVSIRLAQDKDYPYRKFIAVPELDFCGFISKVKLISYNVSKPAPKDKKKFCVSRISYEDGAIKFYEQQPDKHGEQREVLALKLEADDWQALKVS